MPVSTDKDGQEAVKSESGVSGAIFAATAPVRPAAAPQSAPKVPEQPHPAKDAGGPKGATETRSAADEAKAEAAERVRQRAPMEPHDPRAHPDNHPSRLPPAARPVPQGGR